ncbi:MAG TPA: glycosyltransferase family 4 protein [Anaerolineales bacterium]|jgi:glycosyltransferase involved in cell wall biosynthesis
MTASASRRIGFVSTRFAGTDGVSLESEKWAAVLESLGHTCFYFAGECNRPPGRSRVVPEASFRHPAIAAIGKAAFDNEWDAEVLGPSEADKDHFHHKSNQDRVRSPRLTARIQELTDHLKTELYAFARDFDLELLVIENALTIPLNIPLGMAITEFIAETGFPTIGHHHDFYRERMRFMVNSIGDYLSMAFPPALPSIRHVVINSIAGFYISTRLGVSATLIPNVMDFDHPPAPPDEYARDVRSALGLRPDELLFLQPTRIVQRKGIEHAIELTRRLRMKARLVISHASGDEGNSYENRLRAFADLLGTPVLFVSDIIQDQRGKTPDGRKIYTLWDVYAHADLVTYPSTLEGFGNAFLEAIYFRRPLVVNNYSIYDIDIKPKGFGVIEFDGFITEDTLKQTRAVLGDQNLSDGMAERNYQVAKRHYSYSILQQHLQTLLADCFGEGNDH